MKLKKLMQYGIFLILQIVILTVAQGQNMVFYGTTSSGGLNNQGVIFKTDNNGENYTVVHDFNAEDGMRPGYGNLCNVNGVLYGTTDIGGVNNMGVLFSYNIITALYTKLHDFDEQTGQRPKSQVIQASNGKLYGTASSGGLNNVGTLFEFDIQAGTLTKLADFDDENTGRQIFSNVMQASNGKLYGVTNKGGLNDNGVLYEYDSTTEVFSKLFDFSSDTFGSGPTVLVEINNDVLYGTCWGGGDFNGGTIFQYTISTSTMIKKFDFNRLVTGSFHKFSLMKASNGKLYGVTGSGTGEFSGRGGVLFEYDVLTETYSVKQSFNIEMGDDSSSPLLEASNGYLYGLTYYGGLNNKGTLLEYHIDTNQLFKKKDFDTASGFFPKGGLIEIDEFALGVSETNLKVTEVNIWPNPVTDNLFVQAPSSKYFDLKLINSLGQVVLTQINNSATAELNMSSLSRGLYILNVVDENKNSHTIKIIKN